MREKCELESRLRVVRHAHARARCGANEPGVRLRHTARRAPRSDRWEFSRESPLSSALLHLILRKLRVTAPPSLSKRAPAYLKGPASISKWRGRQVDSNTSSRGSPESLNGCCNCQRGKEGRSFLGVRRGTRRRRACRVPHMTP